MSGLHARESEVVLSGRCVCEEAVTCCVAGVSWPNEPIKPLREHFIS